MNDFRTFACIVALVLPLSARAATQSGMPDKPAGPCTLHKVPARQVVKLVFDNVTHATDASLDNLARRVSADVVFSDPMSATQGRAAFREVFSQFMTKDPITYRVLDWSCSGRTVYLDWIFGTKGKATHDSYIEWEGVSKLVLGKDDLITQEMDNWGSVPAVLVPYLRK